MHLIHEFKEPTVRALFLQIKLKRKEWNKAEKANREAARLADENDDDVEQVEWEYEEGQEEEDAGEDAEGEGEQDMEEVDENMVDEDDEERPPTREENDNPRDGNEDEEGGGNEEEDGDQADAEGWEEGEEEEDDDGNDGPIQPDPTSASYGMQQKRDRLQSMQSEIVALQATLCLGLCYMNPLDQDCSDML